MHTPRGAPPGGAAGMGQKYPSMQSVNTLLSQGYLPPGHGYVPKPIKPDKPFGPTFVTVMNRTWRGPGKKYLQYALVAWCVAILFLLATGLYWGHRNVSRMIVLRTEWFGAIFAIIFVCLVGLTFHLIHRARQESNRWRSFVRVTTPAVFSLTMMCSLKIAYMTSRCVNCCCSCNYRSFCSSSPKDCTMWWLTTRRIRQRMSKDSRSVTLTNDLQRLPS